MENGMTNKEKALIILEDVYKNAGPELKFNSVFELLVSVILSAQCTDMRVNKVTEKLFANFNTPEAIAAMDTEELEKYIKSCGLYKNKAKNIKETFAVDTHVFRVANRIGLADAKTPEDTEKQVTALIPEDKWGRAHHWLIHHGRRICHAQNPECEKCPLKECCKKRSLS